MIYFIIFKLFGMKKYNIFKLFGLKKYEILFIIFYNLQAVWTEEIKYLQAAWTETIYIIIFKLFGLKIDSYLVFIAQSTVNKGDLD